MLTPALRVLIAETHYLIAMEVERILVDTLSCQTTIVPIHDLEQRLAGELFDVVVLDANSQETHNRDLAQMIIEQGPAPVFLSSYEDPLDRPVVVRDYPVVPKPFDPDTLAETVRQAAASAFLRLQKPS